MLLSIYTYVKNGLYYDFHVVEMLKHHVDLADEIVVLEGFSSDGTYEAIKDISAKIRIIRSRWDDPGRSYSWYVELKEKARRECRGEWCLHLDADEFIPEWEFDRLRAFVASSESTICPLRVMDFYGNYRIKVSHPLCWRKMVLHRNSPSVEFWGDGANVRIKGVPFDWGEGELPFTIHHFGGVRYPARLREKWHIQAKMYGKGRWFRVPSWVFDWLPHKWDDPEIVDNLEIYEGPYIKAVRENPDEFVRDGMRLCRLLERKTVRASS